MNSRIDSLDAVRGLAVFAMIVFHAAWDLSAFWPHPILQIGKPWWVIGGSVIGGTFLFIAGISASLTPHDSVKLRKRGAKVLAVGIVVSVGSFFFMAQRPIYFGILHCIGVSIILVSFFLREPSRVAWMIVLVFVLGVATEFVQGGGPWLAWAGITYFGFASSDYFPLFPWSGVLFLGWFAGPQWVKRVAGVRGRFGILRFMGRHSLLIYLVHQPILIGIIRVAASVPVP